MAPRPSEPAAAAAAVLHEAGSAGCSLLQLSIREPFPFPSSPRFAAPGPCSGEVDVKCTGKEESLVSKIRSEWVAWKLRRSQLGGNRLLAHSTLVWKIMGYPLNNPQDNLKDQWSLRCFVFFSFGAYLVSHLWCYTTLSFSNRKNLAGSMCPWML